MMPEVGYPKPNLQDWMLLTIGILFVAAGLIILPSNRDVGVVTIALSGPCAALSIATILRKLRFRGAAPLKVELVGGVPIRPSRLGAATYGVAIATIGIILIVFGRSYGLMFWCLAWFIAFIGSSMLLGVAVGLLPVGYIRFDPAGITLAQGRWAYTVPWEAIYQLSGGEYHGNPALGIWLYDFDLITVQPTASRDRVLRHFAQNQVWFGAPIVLFTSRYRMELPLLMKAMQRYMMDTAARAELSRRLIPN
jgi:hypothetical protein